MTILTEICQKKHFEWDYDIHIQFVRNDCLTRSVHASLLLTELKFVNYLCKNYSLKIMVEGVIVNVLVIREGRKLMFLNFPLPKKSVNSLFSAYSLEIFASSVKTGLFSFKEWRLENLDKLKGCINIVHC